MSAQTGILLQSGTNELEIIEFYIDEIKNGVLYRGSYGINVAKVVEIIQQPKPTPVPMAPAEMLGSFIFRGKVIPLFDLTTWLGKTKPKQQTYPISIVTEINNVTTSFAVSGINRIHRLNWGQIEAAGTVLAGYGDLVTGFAKIKDLNILILDMERVVAELSPQQTDQQEDTGGIEGKFKYKALVVDDSPSLINLLCDLLRRAEFETETAINGAEGLRRLRATAQRAQLDRKPFSDFLHIVISDIEMPEMDGYSFCHAIKSDPIFKNLPVILFSSLITDNQRHKGQSVGADDQISKPQSAQLAARAKELIEKSLRQI